MTPPTQHSGKPSENENRNRQDRFSRLVDNTGALVVGVDPQGRITLFNRRCQEVTGYTEEGIEIAACLPVEALGRMKKAGVRVIACPSSKKEEPSPKQHRPRSAPGHR